ATARLAACQTFESLAIRSSSDMLLPPLENSSCTAGQNCVATFWPGPASSPRMCLASPASCLYSFCGPGFAAAPSGAPGAGGGSFGFCATSVDAMPPTTLDACSRVITDGTPGSAGFGALCVRDAAGVGAAAVVGAAFLSASSPSAAKKSPAFWMPLATIQ